MGPCLQVSRRETARRPSEKMQTWFLRIVTHGPLGYLEKSSRGVDPRTPGPLLSPPSALHWPLPRFDVLEAKILMGEKPNRIKTTKFNSTTKEFSHAKLDLYNHLSGWDTAQMDRHNDSSQWMRMLSTYPSPLNHLRVGTTCLLQRPDPFPSPITATPFQAQIQWPACNIHSMNQGSSTRVLSSPEAKLWSSLSSFSSLTSWLTNVRFQGKTHQRTGGPLPPKPLSLRNQSYRSNKTT